MSSIPIDEILKLSPRERLSAVEAIWDSLLNEPSTIPVPPSHVVELKRRLADYESDPEGTTVSWEEVREGARKRFGA
jgi:putative addiction module component (TIGR02574 family)